MSQIADIALAPSGHHKMDWAWAHMPILQALKLQYQRTRPLEGHRVSISLHLEAKTAALAELLHLAGASVRITSSNRLSTQDDVASALSERGVEVFSWHGMDDDDFVECHRQVLEHRPTLLVDDGGELTDMLHHDRRDLLTDVVGGAEETTTGIHRLRAMVRDGELQYPMVAVNNAKMKHLFDNRFGTGQSVWDAIMRTTNVTIAGKTVVVVGFGWCGKGVAERAKGLGATVVVTEVDPIAANEALMSGFQVMPIRHAAKIGDIFVTVTGNWRVIDQDALAQLKDGAILANAGHFDVEINLDALNALSVDIAFGRNSSITGYQFEDGRTIWVLAEGRLVNLVAGDGHPIEIMDLTFGLQAMSLVWVATHAGLKPDLYPVPEEIDQMVASLRLNALGIQIDQLTDEQTQYLHLM